MWRLTFHRNNSPISEGVSRKAPRSKRKDRAVHLLSRASWSYRSCLFDSTLIHDRFSGFVQLNDVLQLKANPWIDRSRSVSPTHFDQFSSKKCRGVQCTDHQRFENPLGIIIAGWHHARCRVVTEILLLLKNEWIVRGRSFLHDQEIVLQKQLIDIRDVNKLEEEKSMEQRIDEMVTM